jgi:hypothetical protein
MPKYAAWFCTNERSTMSEGSRIVCQYCLIILAPVGPRAAVVLELVQHIPLIESSFSSGASIGVTTHAARDRRNKRPHMSKWVR